ncbi:MAG: hypothetical protein Q8N99_06620 [Nanoarchaeota archaeon]|nr:hypothetical protein [Nanoarchaeota archaeon]
MGWFTKNDPEKQVSALPDIQDYGSSDSNIEVPDENNYSTVQDDTFSPNIELNTLPTLPENSIEEPAQEIEIRQAINEPTKIKENYGMGMQRSRFDPVSNEFQEEKVPVKPLPLPVVRTINPQPKLIKKEDKKDLPIFKKSVEMPVLRNPSNPVERSVIKKEPIYIRLDKFETTAQALNEIKEKVTEIERYLIKTKEIRAEEEKELEAWERELEILKSRLDSVDKNIFNSLE